MRNALLATFTVLTAGVIESHPTSADVSGAMTAAHKTLPFGTKVRVTHASTGWSVVVTINDRGPYAPGRVSDLSLAAATAIGMVGTGKARVRLAVLGR